MLMASCLALVFGCADMLEPEKQPFQAEPAQKIDIDARRDFTGENGLYGPGVYPVVTESISQVKISNLSNNNVYLVHINESGTTLGNNNTKIVSTWERSGSVAAEPAASGSLMAGSLPEAVQPVRYDFQDAVNFKPLPRASGGNGGAALMRAQNTLPAAAALVDTSTYIENETTRNFWIRRETGSKDWYELPATLRAKNEFCFVWVANENFDAGDAQSNSDNKISAEQAAGFADKFSLIYQKETALFGYEYGGGPDGDGGVDNLKPVQILAYDIYEDYTANQSGGIVGYFWLKDEYTQAELDSINTMGETYKTNLAELFYMDIHFIDKYPDMAYSTSIHEFQHMIHFNQKNVMLGKLTGTWYNEMLSMLAEDVLCEHLDIAADNSAHPIASRIPLFLGAYNASGITEWLNGDSVLYSYAASFAFGAYLVRNFGGAPLIKQIMTNSDVDEASIINAVKSVNTGLDSWTFNTLLEKFAETVVFTGSSGNNMSFNKTHTGTISSVSYTFKGFDIGTMQRKLSGNSALGPAYFKPDETWVLHPNTFAAISDSYWNNVNGTLTLNLNKPYTNTKLYIMIK